MTACGTVEVELHSSTSKLDYDAGLASRPNALLPSTKWMGGTWTPELVWTLRRRQKSLATAGNGTTSPRTSPYRLSHPSSWLILLPSPSHLRLDLPSGIFPSNFPVQFCIPSHPSYFRIWFQSYTTSSFMNCQIAYEMAIFRNPRNSSDSSITTQLGYINTFCQNALTIFAFTYFFVLT